jgi:hypothetical protein
MKPKRKPADAHLFAESCRSKLIECGGRTICRSHPTNSCRRDAATRSEARTSPPTRGVVLQEYDWRRYVDDVRELAGEEGRRAIPMTTQEADQVLARVGVSRPAGTRPLAENESAPHVNARKLQEARAAEKRGMSSTVAEVIDRRVGVVVAVDPAAGLHTRLAKAVQR